MEPEVRVPGRLQVDGMKYTTLRILGLSDSQENHPPDPGLNPPGSIRSTQQLWPIGKDHTLVGDPKQRLLRFWVSTCLYPVQLRA